MKLKIKGKVQRVGFRYSVVDYVHSENLPLVGYVRNMADGSVEVLAHSDIESLKKLHEFCAAGPPRCEVREIKEELIQIQGSEFSDFIILND